MEDQPGVTISTVKQFVRDGIEKLTRRIKDIVRTEIAETLNIAEVDPGEVENVSGKLKTSNMHLSDILTKTAGVSENIKATYTFDNKEKDGTHIYDHRCI